MVDKMSCTGNQGTICWKVILFLVTVTMQLVYPVISLEESFCAGTGYYNLNYGGKSSIRGYRTTGWDRLFAVDKPFTSFFWSVQAFLKDNNDPKEDIRFVRDHMGIPMHGWIYIRVQRPSAFPFHFVAVWAVTQRNEVYGTFLFGNQYTLRCPGLVNTYAKPYAYIPCSAGPANVDTVPNMFIYANLRKRTTDSSNMESIVEAKVVGRTNGANEIHLLWRSPPQSYCNRPRKFQFIFAYTPIERWDTWAKGWNGATMPLKGMWHEGNIHAGPVVHKSPWIYPHYYGHPSNHDPVTTLNCFGHITVDKEAWVRKYELLSINIDDEWYTDKLYPEKSKMMEGNFNHSDVIHRSTCKGANPKTTMEVQAFGGRCSKSVSDSKLSYVTASSNSQLKCSDKNENMGKDNFKDSYSEHLDTFKNMLQNECECNNTTTATTTMKTAVPANNFRSRSGANRPLGRSRSLAEADGHPRKNLIYSRNKEIYQQVQDDTKYKVTSYKRDHDVCSTDHVNLSSKAISDKGGICVQTPAGKLVYGVRQWHGLTCLGVSLVITPMSIFIARYHKGDMILEDGKVQIRPWYLAHILLVFPAIWMYASGIYAMGRQTDVMGHSLTLAAKIHRILGVVTIALIPVHAITGFLRPLSLISRRMVIYIHWLGGIVQHILEISLCCTAFLIPASPTTGSSVFSSHFGVLYDSFESQLVLGWFAFSVAFHLLQTVRVKRRDCRNGIDSRSVFPVIIPQFSRFDEELILDTEQAEPVIMADDVQDLWFERGSLLIFGLVSGIVFVVAVVSLYQELHENLYYGFGPMSCTHNAQGRFISASRGDGSDDSRDKMENTCN